MANIKSAKKQAKQNIKRRLKNLVRNTSVKTAMKKVLIALEKGEDIAKTQELLRDAEAKISRAKSKHLLHTNTARRKISGLAKKVAQATRSQ
jgi:small subunit ribosomal protein S20